MTKLLSADAEDCFCCCCCCCAMTSFSEGIVIRTAFSALMRLSVAPPGPTMSGCRQTWRGNSATATVSTSALPPHPSIHPHIAVSNLKSSGLIWLGLGFGTFSHFHSSSGCNDRIIAARLKARGGQTSSLLAWSKSSNKHTSEACNSVRAPTHTFDNIGDRLEGPERRCGIARDHHRGPQKTWLCGLAARRGQREGRGRDIV